MTHQDLQIYYAEGNKFVVGKVQYGATSDGSLQQQEKLDTNLRQILGKGFLPIL